MSPPKNSGTTILGQTHLVVKNKFLSRDRIQSTPNWRSAERKLLKRSKHVEATYRAAKAAGALPLLWFSVVVVAPVTEELFFRGFLHCGWAPSWLGVSGTIVLTSALWAVLHHQYNAFGILIIFVVAGLSGKACGAGMPTLKRPADLC